ncbi:MAG: 3-hydroxyacyl-[acyl-carrier-protein] dehydratase FabZ [Candidatus Dadabacteria bacterium]|nr:MAG: 3-hydroxyacyl-[acyl-carrier-protein] dehydratase FabZ [Candidatus Dadabacteria bacterium]
MTEAAEEALFDINDIQEILPHRYPFLLIDRIVEFVPGEKIVAVKNVTMNEAFFAGHFPGKPVMPGVMILEAMGQAGVFLAKKSPACVPPDKILYFVGVKDFKWKKPVLPGDRLYLEMSNIRHKGPLWIMDGWARVDGKVVAQGTLSAAEGE